MTSSPGRHVRQAALGLRIVRADGARLSFGRATARHFLKAMITPLVPFAVGYLLAAFTTENGRCTIYGRYVRDKNVLHNQGRSTCQRSNSGAAAPPPSARLGCSPSRPATVGYGGFWIRVVAYIIDAILLSVAAASSGSYWRRHLTRSRELSSSVHRHFSSGWLYFALMESSERGATVGKMAVGLRVVTDKGQRLAFQMPSAATSPSSSRRSSCASASSWSLHGPEARPARHDGQHAGGQSAVALFAPHVPLPRQEAEHYP